MERNTKKSVLADLNDYCHLAKKDDYIEVTEWVNGEGFDVDINTERFSLTYGQLRAIKKLVKELEK